MKIKNTYEFQDMLISSLRYALGRKTYITDVTADFIKSYPEVIDKRVRTVMLNDLRRYFDFRILYKHTDDECDYNTWCDLRKWLEDKEVE